MNVLILVLNFKNFLIVILYFKNFIFYIFIEFFLKKSREVLFLKKPNFSEIIPGELIEVILFII